MIYTLLEPEHPILLTKLPEITAETEPEDRKELLDNMVETMKKYLALIMCLVVASCSIVYAGLNKETVERVKQATVFIVMKSYLTNLIL